MNTGRASRIFAFFGAAALAGVTACESQEKQASLPDHPEHLFDIAPQWDSSRRPVTQMIGSPPIRADQARPTELVSRQRLDAARSSVEGSSPAILDSQPGELIRVKYTCRDAEPPEVLRVLIGEYLQRDYMLAPALAGKITMDVDQEMTRADIEDMLGGLCMIYGWVLEDRGDLIFVQPDARIARTSTAPILQARAAFENDSPAIRVRTLRYIQPGDVSNVLPDFMSPNAKVAAVGRTLVMVDSVRQINKISRLLSAVDVAEFDGVEIWTYRLGTRSPNEAVDVLTQITSATKLASGPDPLVSFLPIANTNKLMVVSKDPTVQNLVHSFITQVDQAEDQIQRARYLYRCQHYEPASLANLLRETFKERMARSEDDPTDTGVRIIQDPVNELLIFHATPDDYAEMLQMIDAIDRAPLQVRIQSTILEVGLTNELQWGVDYFLEAYSGDLGILELAGGTAAPAVPTGSAFFVGGSGFALITALATESEVNILSRPEFFVLDGGTTSFQVGGEVPVITQDVTSNQQIEGTTGIRRNIEYRPTGVILEVQPKINERGEIRLKIHEEITDVGNITELGPEFTTRNIDTDAVVPHGHTLIIGGIIRSEKRKTIEKIPLLGDVPVLGLAFQGIEDREIKVELLLAITPTIVAEPTDNSGYISDFMRSANAVRKAIESFEDEFTDESLIWVSPLEMSPAAPIPGSPQEQSDSPPQLPDLLRSILEQPGTPPEQLREPREDASETDDQGASLRRSIGEIDCATADRLVVRTVRT